jgi:hypothetical protein
MQYIFLEKSFIFIAFLAVKATEGTEYYTEVHLPLDVRHFEYFQGGLLLFTVLAE